MSEEDNEELDSQNQATDEVEKTDAEDTVASTETEDTEKLKETNKRLFERAKKAEAEAKALKAEKANLTTNADTDPIEVAALANALRDLSSEEISFAKTIAAGSKTSLLKALETDGFKAYHKEQAAIRRREEAKLGASKGSSQSTEKSPSEMSREEHEKWAMDQASKVQ